MAEDERLDHIHGVDEDVELKERVKTKELKDDVGQIQQFDQQIEGKVSQRAPAPGLTQPALQRRRRRRRGGGGGFLVVWVVWMVWSFIDAVVVGVVGLVKVGFDGCLHVLAEVGVENVGGVVERRPTRNWIRLHFGQVVSAW